MTDNRVYFAIVNIPERAARQAYGQQVLRQVVSQVTGLPPDLYCIATEPSGRPVATVRDGTPAGIFISLSHSGVHLAAVATAIGPIGVDIERAKPRRNLAGIAQAAFGPAERRRCDRDGADGFYRIWTLREAIAKALGAGLVMAADRVDRVADGPDEGYWKWQGWQLAHHRVAAGLSFAVAVRPDHALAENIVWQDVTPDGS
jgi:phosphopantetheinyl transferase